MKIEMVKEFINQHRKGIAVTVAVTAVVGGVGGISYAALNINSSEPVRAESTQKQEVKKFEKDVKKEDVKVDYLKYVKGLKDWTVEVGTSKVDFLEGVEWDKKYINDVKVDASQVKLDKAGKYSIVYTVYVKVDGSDLKVTKTVTVEVIDKKTAEQKIKEGKEVVTSEGTQNKQESKPSSIYDGGVDITTDVPSYEEDNNTGSSDNGGNTNTNSGGSSVNNDNTNTNTDNGGNSNTGNNNTNNGGNSNTGNANSGNTNNGGSSNNSGNNGGGNSNGGNTNVEPPKVEEPAHTHNYNIPITQKVDKGHEDQVLVREAWTETVSLGWHSYCNICGGCLDGQRPYIDEEGDGVDPHRDATGHAGGNYYTKEDFDEIPHPAEYTTQWVENWVDEVVGYKCSCGLEQR